MRSRTTKIAGNGRTAEGMPSRRRSLSTAFTGTAAAVGVTALGVASAAVPSRMALLINEHRRAAADDLAAVLAHDRAEIESGAIGNRGELEQLELAAQRAFRREEAARRRLFAHRPADLGEASERARYILDSIEPDTIEAADVVRMLKSYLHEK